MTLGIRCSKSLRSRNSPVPLSGKFFVAPDVGPGELLEVRMDVGLVEGPVQEQDTFAFSSKGTTPCSAWPTMPAMSSNIGWSWLGSLDAPFYAPKRFTTSTANEPTTGSRIFNCAKASMDLVLCSFALIAARTTLGQVP
jgi:hypothetical protein